MNLVGYVRSHEGHFGTAHDWRLVQYPVGYRKPKSGRNGTKVRSTYVEQCQPLVVDIIRRHELHPATMGDEVCKDCLALRRAVGGK